MRRIGNLLKSESCPMRFCNFVNLFFLKSVSTSLISSLQVVESRIELVNKLGELEISQKSDWASLLESLTVSISLLFITFFVYNSGKKTNWMSSPICASNSFKNGALPNLFPCHFVYSCPHFTLFLIFTNFVYQV